MHREKMAQMNVERDASPATSLDCCSEFHRDPERLNCSGDSTVLRESSCPHLVAQRRASSPAKSPPQALIVIVAYRTVPATCSSSHPCPGARRFGIIPEVSAQVPIPDVPAGPRTPLVPMQRGTRYSTWKRERFRRRRRSFRARHPGSTLHVPVYDI